MKFVVLDSTPLGLVTQLSAQILAAGFQLSDFTVATSNVGHISLFVPADIWSNI